MSNELNSEFGPYVLERVISDKNESDIIENIITKTVKKKLNNNTRLPPST